jgi:hypothetical protein
LFCVLSRPLSLVILHGNGTELPRIQNFALSFLNACCLVRRIVIFREDILGALLAEERGIDGYSLNVFVPS